MSNENKPYITRPTTQLDLEARQKRDNLPVTEQVDPNATNAPYAVEGNDTSGYIGVDPDKMTYANDTEAPLRGTGAEDKVAKEQLSGYAYGEDPKPKGEQTLGSGSSAPLVGVTTSGESTTHKMVDREKLQKELDRNSQKAANGEKVEPIRSTAKFVTEAKVEAKSESKSDEKDSEDAAPTPSQKIPPKADAPKPSNQ